MRRATIVNRWLACVATALTAVAAQAAMVQQMSMGDLVHNADKVFRGTVMSREPGTVMGGGSEMATVVYVIRVDEPLKGDFGSGKEAQSYTLTMLGSIKAGGQTVNGKTRLTDLNINPELQVGSEYVLFTSAPSRIGLSSTIGLGQGLFRIMNDANGRDMATNGYDNRTLFNGPVSYDELKAAVSAEMQ